MKLKEDELKGKQAVAKRRLDFRKTG